jgi:hypothetical protein
VLGSESEALWPRFSETHRLLLTWLPHAEGFALPGATHFLGLRVPTEAPCSLARSSRKVKTSVRSPVLVHTPWPPLAKPRLNGAPRSGRIHQRVGHLHRAIGRKGDQASGHSERPVVQIAYEASANQGKARRLAGDAEFAAIYKEYLARRHPPDMLFPYGFQAINEMVARVAAAAELTKHITPRVLRHAVAIERARQGADERALLAVLGLADDPRNRKSVRRYLNLAPPPL